MYSNDYSASLWTFCTVDVISVVFFLSVSCKQVKMNVARATNLNIGIMTHPHIATPPSPKLSRDTVPRITGVNTIIMATSEQKMVGYQTPGGPIETNAPHPLPKMCQEPLNTPRPLGIRPLVNTLLGGSPIGLLLLGLPLLQQITGSGLTRVGNQFQGPTLTTPTKIQGLTSTLRRTTSMH